MTFNDILIIDFTSYYLLGAAIQRRIFLIPQTITLEAKCCVPIAEKLLKIMVLCFFIIQGLIGSSQTIPLKCMCGAVRQWEAPHDSTAYCQSCGSRFSFLEMEKGTGYIITSNGPVKPIGSDVPDFESLSPDKQRELLKEYEELVKNAKK
jgi:hypothetical protein